MGISPETFKKMQDGYWSRDGYGSSSPQEAENKKKAEAQQAQAKSRAAEQLTGSESASVDPDAPSASSKLTGKKKPGGS